MKTLSDFIHPMSRQQCTIATELHRQLKVSCAVNGRKIAHVLDDIVSAYLNRKTKNKTQ